MLRRVLFWSGWVLLLVYAGIFAGQAYVIQDIPPISVVKWVILGATVILIFAARNKDEVVAHHLPH
jgi:membrane protein DedA with SNARE-associated domain